VQQMSTEEEIIEALQGAAIGIAATEQQP